jgi:gas vesicle protein
MSGLNTATKTAVGVKAAKTVAKRPRVLGAGGKAAIKVAGPAAKLGKPLAKRQIRRKARRWGDAATALTSTLAAYAPGAARELGLIVEQAPPRKRTAPRVAVGIVIGAAGAYLLDPERGPERRRKVLEVLPLS